MPLWPEDCLLKTVTDDCFFANDQKSDLCHGEKYDLIVE